MLLLLGLINWVDRWSFLGESKMLAWLLKAESGEPNERCFFPTGLDWNPGCGVFVVVPEFQFMLDSRHGYLPVERCKGASLTLSMRPCRLAKNMGFVYPPLAASLVR